MSARGDAAVGYATQLGWKILPVWWAREDGSCACGDGHVGQANNIGKHPVVQVVPQGLKDSSNDPAVVRSWWELFPDANPALDCAGSGLIVIDVDPRHNGDETLADLELQHPELGSVTTLRARTGGGGRHLFLRAGELATAGLRPRGKLGPGVDVKYHGYVLLSPSNHRSGQTYVWDTSGVGPADLGPWLELIAAGRQAAPGSSDGTQAGSAGGSETGSILDLNELFAGVPAGGRHDAFKSYAARLRAKRLHYEEARAVVETAWARAEQSAGEPFPLAEALQLLDWAWTLPPGTTAEQAFNLDAYAGYIASVEAGTAPRLNELNRIVVASNGHPPSVQDRLNAIPEALRPGVMQELMRRDVRQLANNLLAAEAFQEPRGDRLDVLLERGIVEPVWTIDQLHERGTNMSLTAQFKAGKTTLQLNMLKALADREPFLGRYAVRELQGNMAFFNYELTEDQFIRWAGRMRIAHPERVFVVNLRGMRLDVGDSYVREWLTSWLRQHEIEFWWLDPLARAYYGDENDNTQLKEWTDVIDIVKREAGVVDAQVSLHTGRAIAEEGEERARGATRIDDWVDGRMVLVRRGEHRFLRAEGREVDVPETMLTFDPETWRLEVSNLAAGEPVSRRTFAHLQGVEYALDALRELGAVGRENAVSRTAGRNAIRHGKITDRDAWIASAIRERSVWEDRGARSGTIVWIPSLEEQLGGVEPIIDVSSTEVPLTVPPGFES